MQLILENTLSGAVNISFEDEFLKITQCYGGPRLRNRVDDDQTLYFESDLS